MKTDYDIAVIGGGIAGLAIAEIFSRDGQRVVIIERDSLFCAGASAAQHGWFHFGSLYSIFPQTHFLKTMIAGVEDLLKYYSGFTGMNIRIGEAGRLTFEQSEDAWFRDEPIEYIIPSRRDPDFSLFKAGTWRKIPRKLFFLATWEYAIKQFISRHRRFQSHNWNGGVAASVWIPKAGIGDYSREVIEKPSLDETIDLDRNTHFQIKGYDRPMRSRAIAASLLKQFVAQGGTFQLNSEVSEIVAEGGNRIIKIGNRRPLTVGTVIVATGQWLKDLAPKDLHVKTVVSPLLVTYPAVANRHFVRMTPFVEKSINHIWHEISGRKYSVIGGGYYADPGNAEEVKRTREDLRLRAEAVFPGLKNVQILESYSGYKTELANGDTERNYQFFIQKIDNTFFAVLPGKYSLSFSLAIKTFKSITGREPPQKHSTRGTQNKSVAKATGKDLENLISLPKHASLASGKFS
jgi:glycine/D-amino acid oxidase-like deaminating enzyme